MKERILRNLFVMRLNYAPWSKITQRFFILLLEVNLMPSRWLRGGLVISQLPSIRWNPPNEGFPDPSSLDVTAAAPRNLRPSNSTQNRQKTITNLHRVPVQWRTVCPSMKLLLNWSAPSMTDQLHREALFQWVKPNVPLFLRNYFSFIWK